MTHDEHAERSRFLARKVASLLGHSRSGRYTLAEKLEKKEKYRAACAELSKHKLNYFTLVDE